MGGWGSGRRGGRETTSDYRRLDVRELQRGGWLSDGASFNSKWSRRGVEISSIRGRSESDRVVLTYRHQYDGKEWESLEYPIFLERTPCNYGGTRTWFLCPGQRCGRRVAALYSGKYFLCRHCRQLAYESQHESPGDRADSRAWKIRERCGGWGCLLDPLFRRKGMHHRTFERLARDYEQACSASDFAFCTKMGMSMDEVLRLTERL